MRISTSITIGSSIIGGCIVWSSYAFPQSVADWPDVPNVIIAAGIFVLAFFAFKGQRAIEWFTGAMENHSHQQRMIAAKEAGVEIVWWDHSRGRIPTTGKHGDPFTLERIYIGVPIEDRMEQPSWLAKRFGTRTVGRRAKRAEG